MNADGPADAERGRVLLEIARETLSAAFGGETPAGHDTAWLHRPGACFVTLKKGGALRGCIGSLRPNRTLIEDLRRNTVAAALRDDRFPPLTAEELGEVTIEVSLLSELEPLPFAGERQLVAALRPGIDGVVLECGLRRGTFLPAVWRNLADPADFVRQLKRKAGLAEDFWSDEIAIFRYTTRSWSEQ